MYYVREKQLSKLCIHGGVDRIEMYMQTTRDDEPRETKVTTVVRFIIYYLSIIIIIYV